MPLLERQTAEGMTHFHDLVGATTLIGRFEDCDLRLDSTSVSRHHAVVKQEGNGFYVEDLGSRNGTYVNGIRIGAATPLHDGDELRIHDTTLTFRTSIPLELPLDEPGPLPGTLESSTVMELLDSSQDKLRIVVQAATEFARQRHLEEIDDALLETVLQMFPSAERCTIIERDSTHEGGLKIRSVRERRHPGTAPQRTFPNRWIFETTLSHGEAVRTFDLMTEKGADDTALSRAVMCVPLDAASEEPSACVMVDCVSTSQVFTDEDLRIFTAVALIASQNIQNRLLTQKQMRAEVQYQHVQLARRVQHALVPPAHLHFAGYEISHLYQPARDLSGDYLDCFELWDGRWILAVGDATGKGVSAALQSARISAALRLVMHYEIELAQAMTRLNELLHDTPLDGAFITMLLGVLDPHSDRLELVHAGHPLPILCRNGETHSPIPEYAMSAALGLDPNTEFRAVQVELQPGDRLLLFTDGVTEARNSEKKLFGSDRLSQLLARTPGDTRNMLAAVVHELGQYTGREDFEDDLTMLALLKDARTENA